jgi:molybdopterin-guanine dinucleotide biosynthesis protein
MPITIICGSAGTGKTTLAKRILESAHPDTRILEDEDAMPAGVTLVTSGHWIIVTQNLERIPILIRAASTMLYTATPGSDHKFDVVFNRAAPLRYSD